MRLILYPENFTIAMMRSVALTVFLLATFVVVAVEWRPEAAAQQRTDRSTIALQANEAAFLMLSDIHFDPLTGTDPHVIEQLAAAPVEKWQSLLSSQPNPVLAPDGADANYPLLSSALDAARRSGVHYDYILVMGDFLGHNFPEKYRRLCRPDGSGYPEFAIKTMAFVSRLIEQAFPAVPIYPAFGNNDSVIGDYAPQGQSLLAAMGEQWKVVAAHPSAKADFLAGGYYAVPHPTVPSFEFVVLNTSYWSEGFKSDAASARSDPGSLELDWLTAQLDRLRRGHERAAIAMHIPPGIDAYASAKSGNCASPTTFWRQPYLDSFLAILAAHKDTVRDGYAGHTHLDDFRVLAAASGTPYFQTHIAPSISRDHHNSPGFETGVYDRSSGAMVNYTASYLRNAPPGASRESDWRPAYDFRRDSGLANYSPTTLQTMALLVRSSEVVRNRIMESYGLQTLAPSAISMMMMNWRFYSCAQTEFEPGAFGGCACHSPAANN